MTAKSHPQIQTVSDEAGQTNRRLSAQRIVARNRIRARNCLPLEKRRDEKTFIGSQRSARRNFSDARTQLGKGVRRFRGFVVLGQSRRNQASRVIRFMPETQTDPFHASANPNHSSATWLVVGRSALWGEYRLICQVTEEKIRMGRAVGMADADKRKRRNLYQPASYNP